MVPVLQFLSKTPDMHESFQLFFGVPLWMERFPLQVAPYRLKTGQCWFQHYQLQLQFQRLAWLYSAVVVSHQFGLSLKRTNNGSFDYLFPVLHDSLIWKSLPDSMEIRVLAYPLGFIPRVLVFIYLLVAPPQKDSIDGRGN
jgi:hypothetical protein